MTIYRLVRPDGTELMRSVVDEGCAFVVPTHVVSAPYLVQEGSDAAGWTTATTVPDDGTEWLDVTVFTGPQRG